MLCFLGVVFFFTGEEIAVDGGLLFVFLTGELIVSGLKCSVGSILCLETDSSLMALEGVLFLVYMELLCYVYFLYFWMSLDL